MSTDTTTYDAMIEAAEIDDLRATLEEVEVLDPSAPAIVSTTDDRKLRVEHMTAAEVAAALLQQIAAVDIYAAPLAGPDIDGMRRIDYLGQSLSDEDIITRAEARHPGIDTAAVIWRLEGPVPEVETVGDWIDAAADAEVTERG